jgi:hypothetical protein
MVCAQLPLTGSNGAPAAAPTPPPEEKAVPSNTTITNPSPVYIEYAPVVYLQTQQPSNGWQGDINNLITFLVRCGAQEQSWDTFAPLHS